MMATPFQNAENNIRTATFKHIDCNRGVTITCEIHRGDSVSTFLEKLKNPVLQHYNLDRFEVIEVQEYYATNENGARIAPEDAVAVTSENTSVYDKFQNTLDHLAFYIRPIHVECPVCYDTQVERRCFYGCTHAICIQCANDWHQHIGYARCPICRNTP
jgi:hypothetical protein